MAFAKGDKAWGISDRSGFRYRLKEMKREWTGLLVGPDEFEPKHPQLRAPRATADPEALRNPRPDTTYFQAGLNANGNPSDGSRVIQWGWNPVGLDNPLGLSGLVNVLEAQGAVGTVTVQTE